VDKDVAKQIGGWKTDAIFTRYNISSEEDVLAAMQKVAEYNETQAKKVVAIGGSR
jgi:hypothetical protein